MSRHVLQISLGSALVVGMLACDAAGESGRPPRVPPVAATARMTYVDPHHRFSVAYPKDFVIKPQDVAKLAGSIPTPLASIYFMNPTMATGDLAEIEPPDLEVRVYRSAAVDTLDRWLDSAGLGSIDSGATREPYRRAGVSGLRVCQATLLAPGCSVYILHRDRVYQLTPISVAGEAIVKTFALLP